MFLGSWKVSCSGYTLTVPEKVLQFLKRFQWWIIAQPYGIIGFLSFGEGTVVGTSLKILVPEKVTRVTRAYWRYADISAFLIKYLTFWKASCGKLPRFLKRFLIWTASCNGCSKRFWLWEKVPLLERWHYGIKTGLTRLFNPVKPK